MANQLEFEECINEIDVEIGKRRGKWCLSAICWMDYDDVSQILRTSQKVRTTHFAHTYESLANTSKIKVFYAIGHHPRAGTGSITASQHHERDCVFAFHANSLKPPDPDSESENDTFRKYLPNPCKYK